MSRLPDTFHQDRALRDAARDVLFADVDHAKRSLSKEGLSSRFTSRIQDGAQDALEVTKVQAHDKRGLIAGVIALLALWFARQPLLEILGLAEPALGDVAILDEDADADSDAGPIDNGDEVESSEPVGEEAIDNGGKPDD